MHLNLNSDIQGEGPDLVLLHGWGMNGGVWATLLPRLTPHFRVTRIDLPGHGGSPFDPEADSIGAWGEACLAAAPERAVWLGWSLGGQVAQWVAVNHPGRVAGLVSVCGSPRFTRADDWPHGMVRGTLQQFAGALAANYRQTLDRFLALQVRGDDDARATLRLLRQEIATRPEADPRALEMGLGLLRGVDLREELLRLCVPSLWLFGERDQLIPSGVAEDLRLLLSAQRPDIRVLPRAAHAPFISAPGAFMEALSEFAGLDLAAKDANNRQ